MRPGKRLRSYTHNPLAVAAATALLLLAILSVIGPAVFGSYAAQIHVVHANEGPSAQHFFGTDQLGRDIFARTLSATQLSLELAAIASGIGVVVGVPLGLLPTVLGRRAGRFTAAVIGTLIAFPGLLLALFVNTILGVGAPGAVLGIGIALIPTMARLTQTLSASVAGLDYVAATRILGVGRIRLMLRHVLPNIAEPIVLTAAMSVGWALLGISALSFLGLGVRPPSYDWGALLGVGLQSVYTNPLASLGPGMLIVFAGLSFNFLGETLAGSFGLRGLVARPLLFGSLEAAYRARTARLGEAGGPVPALSAANLNVAFATDRGVIRPVADVDLDIATGEAIGVVGESGSGKTMMASALAQLVPYPGRVTWDRLEFGGQELNRLSGRARERFLAAAVAMVFQDPMTSLNPAIRLGRQVGEIGEVHLGMSRRAARQAVEQRLGEVQLPDAHGLVHRYPHELSGGMRQRAVLAMGLMGEPRIIIADEPTTALDVTVQREVLELLRRLNRDSHISVVLISHDISVVASLCHRVLVMYAGRIVEELLVKDLLQRAAHPYTVALLAAIPDMGVVRGEPLSSIPGRPPDLDKLSAGCPFAPRCSRADATCEAELPPLRELRAGQRAACWHPVNVAEVPGTAPLVQA